MAEYIVNISEDLGDFDFIAVESLRAQTPLIRCKDYKLHGTNGDRLNCAIFCCTMPDGGFCSCGERKEHEIES